MHSSLPQHISHVNPHLNSIENLLPHNEKIEKKGISINLSYKQQLCYSLIFSYIYILNSKYNSLVTYNVNWNELFKLTYYMLLALIISEGNWKKIAFFLSQDLNNRLLLSYAIFVGLIRWEDLHMDKFRLFKSPYFLK